MRRRYESAAVGATAVFAPVGLVLLAFSGMVAAKGRKTAAPGPWLGLWIGFALPLLAARAFAGDGPGLLAVLGQILLVLAAAMVLTVHRYAVVQGLLAGLVVLVVAGLAANWWSARSWQPFGGSQVARVGVTASGSVDTLAAREEAGREDYRHEGAERGAGIVALRSWALPLGTQALELSFDARLAAGTPDWDWFRSQADIQLERLEENGENFTRIVTPLGNDPYVYRRADLGEPLAHRRLRARVEMRAPTAPGCGRLYLAEPGARHVHFKEICLDGRWQSFELEWQVPETARSSSVDVNLNDFDGTTIDVRRVRLDVWEEHPGNGWYPVAPLAPTGVLLVADWPGRPSNFAPHLRWLPEEEWQRHRLVVTHESLPDAGLLQARVLFGGGFAVQLRNVTLAPLDSQPSHPVPLRPEPRQALWFTHPNLLGHSIAVTGLVLLVNLRSGWIGLLGMLLSLAGVWLTGSRAAWLAATAGSLWLLWLLLSPRVRPWVLTGLATAGLFYLAIFGIEGLGRFQPFSSDTVTSRSDIWQVAWQAMTDYPLSGLGQDGFAHYWQEHYRGDSTEIVHHAHNLWLALASSYGLPGFVAALWLSLGLVLLGWSWGRLRGLALVLSVLVMNFFDYTLFHSSVLFPLLLGLNALRGDGPEHPP